MMQDNRDLVRRLVLEEARRWIGTPYRHQGSTRRVGCDCLGLIRGVWRSVYGEEPQKPDAYAPDWAEAGEVDLMLDAARRWFDVVPVEDAMPGDLLLFRWRPGMACKHAGILDERGRFVHAYQGHAVLASALVHQWRRRIAAAFIFPMLAEKDY